MPLHSRLPTDDDRIVGEANQEAGIAIERSVDCAGLYVHGRINILDRPGLERASCECYLTVKEHFDRPGL